MKTERNLHMFINCNLSYPSYSNYIQEASKHGIRFTIVKPPRPTPIGLVLANETKAIDQTNFFY